MEWSCRDAADHERLVREFDLDALGYYYHGWFAHAPTHHCAMSVGHNAGQFAKVAELMQLEDLTL